MDYDRCVKFNNLQLVCQKLKRLFICAFFLYHWMNVLFLTGSSTFIWRQACSEKGLFTDNFGSMRAHSECNKVQNFLGCTQGGCMCPELLMRVAITRNLDLDHWQRFFFLGLCLSFHFGLNPNLIQINRALLFCHPILRIIN